MCGQFVIILLAIVTQAQSQELAGNRNWPQSYGHKQDFSDKLVDKLVDKFIERTLKVLPLHDLDLDYTRLQKKAVNAAQQAADNAGSKEKSGSGEPKLAIVEKIMGRTGMAGGLSQVRVQLFADPPRAMLRNVKGPVWEGDIIVLRNTEVEARPGDLQSKR